MSTTATLPLTVLHYLLGKWTKKSKKDGNELIKNVLKTKWANQKCFENKGFNVLNGQWTIWIKFTINLHITPN